MQPNGFPTGKYGPFGHNDNNLNKRRVPSNRYPPKVGLSGSGFGNFQPISTYQLNHMSNNKTMANFYQAYAPQPSAPLIEKMDYTNYNKLLHNNVGDIVLDPHIVEYRINIDSLDRDIKTYPNPFDFRVTFSTPSSGVVRTESIKNGKLIFRREFFHGPPKPHINKSFKNVKYVKLDNIILPQFGNIIENDKGKFVFDTVNTLVDDRFIMLVVKEIICKNRIYCTYDGNTRFDPSVDKTFIAPCPFAHILPKDVFGKFFYSGEPYYGNKIYKSSTLGNIGSMTIKLFNSFGKPLKFDNLFTHNDLVAAEQDGHPIPLTDIRHPLNFKIQTHLSFVIGVVESQISTDTKFVLN
uniref:Uncharacterized protein n=1 Tax=Mimivirus LCMiAC01 TaxID=2506608 RepID=A0A481Z1A3_9VIRU|nr:MAG: uncharacterized protein LCMiAC01_01530 [Mimivirus LCMiAC01]